MRTHVVPALLLLLAALPNVATADCAHTTMRSTHDTTTPTGWLILEGGGDAEPYLLGLRDQRVTLVSGRHKVPATVVAVNEGRLNIVQTILKPLTELKLGRTYTLATQRGHGIARGLHYGLSRLAWKVVEPGPRATWKAAPVAAGGDRAEFGCGPAVNISVETPLSAPVRGVWATVSPADGSVPAVTWLFGVRADGRIRVGHGMCSGPVTFKKGQRMVIRVTGAVSLDGTSVPTPGSGVVESLAP